MRQVYLPTEHSETDLVLAGLVAELLQSSRLYVTWSPRGYEQPVIETIVRPASAPAPTISETPVPGLLTVIVDTMATIVALFAPRPSARRKDAPAV